MKGAWLFILFAFSTLGYSQVEFSVSAINDRILIGDQFDVVLKAKVPADARIQWPNVPEIGSGMLVNRSGIDTLSANNNELDLREKWTLTSFDSGFVVLPPVELFVNNNGYTSDPLIVQVDLPNVEGDYADIVDPLDVSRPWWEWALYGLGLIGITILISQLISSKYKNKNIQAKPKDTRPLKQRVLSAMNGIVDQTNWNNPDEVDAAYNKSIRLVYKYISAEFKVNTGIGDFGQWSTLLIRNPHFVGDIEVLRNLISKANEIRFGGLELSADEYRDWAVKLNKWIEESSRTVEPVNGNEHVEV